MESVVDGDYQIDIYSKDGGPYYLTIYSYDDHGNYNNQIDLVGEIEPQGHLVSSYVHSGEPLTAVNANIHLNRSSFERERRSGLYDIHAKGLIRSKNSNERERLEIQSSVSIIIGGDGGFKKVIPASQLRKKRRGRSYFYQYKDRRHHFSFKIDKFGNFDINARKIDLSSVPEENRDLFTLSIDQLTGSSKLVQKPRFDVKKWWHQITHLIHSKRKDYHETHHHEKHNKFDFKNWFHQIMKRRGER